jgi:putative flippase GtrA
LKNRSQPSALSSPKTDADAGGRAAGAESSVADSPKIAQRRTLLRWMKFNLVGGIGIAVQLAALAFFRSILKLNYLWATAVAVEIAVLHNFLWHERFTWRDRPSRHAWQSLVRLAKFNATNGAVSIAGNLLIMRVLVGQAHVNYIVANLIAVAICSIVNFLLSDQLVFERG